MKQLLLAAALIACHSDPTGGAIDGPTIFATACARCHGPTGKPDAEMAARINPRDLTSTELRARVSEKLVENQVRFGSQNHLMPPFEGTLTEVQIHNVAVFVASPAFISAATSGSGSK